MPLQTHDNVASSLLNRLRPLVAALLALGVIVGLIYAVLSWRSGPALSERERKHEILASLVDPSSQNIPLQRKLDILSQISASGYAQ